MVHISVIRCDNCGRETTEKEAQASGWFEMKPMIGKRFNHFCSPACIVEKIESAYGEDEKRRPSGES